MNEWQTASGELSEFYYHRFVNRTDVWGEWEKSADRLIPKTRPKREESRIEGVLDASVIHNRILDKKPIGLHTTSTNNTCKWICYDFDSTPYEQGSNEYYHEKIYQAERIEGICTELGNWGLSCLLEQSSLNRHHLWVLFENPIPSQTAHWFGNYVAKNNVNVLLANTPVEVFPKQPELLPHRPYGNWVRLPGPHHKTDWYSGIYEKWQDVWSGSCEGTEAISLLLSAKLNDGAKIIDIDWKSLVENQKPQVVPKSINVSSVASSDRISQAKKYAQNYPIAVSGKGGDQRTYHMAMMLVHGFGLTVDEGMECISDWNNRCEPPWTNESNGLEYKCKDVFAKSTSGYFDKPRGWMLEKIENEPKSKLEVRSMIYSVSGSDTKWIWNNYLFHGGLTLMGSDAKVGKTTLLSALLAAGQTGGELFSSSVAKFRALVITEESPVHQLWPTRSELWGLGHNHHGMIYDFPQKPKADVFEEYLGEVDKLAHDYQLVVFDTFSKMTPTSDGNNACDWQRTFASLKRKLSNSGVAVLLCCHHRKRDKKGSHPWSDANYVVGENIVGSSDQAGQSDINIDIFKHNQERQLMSAGRNVPETRVVYSIQENKVNVIHREEL